MPTESKSTVAWARDPSPLALITTPWPQWSCTTSSPGTRPRSSAPVLPRGAGRGAARRWAGRAAGTRRPAGTAGAKVGPGQVLLARQPCRSPVPRAANRARRPRPGARAPRSTKRLGMAGWVRPQVVRDQAWEMARWRRARVMPDVEEPALLLELARLGERAEVGEDPLLQPDHEDGRVLQPLGRVQRHQRDPGAVAVELVGVRHQRHGLEEAQDVVEVGGLAWPARPGSRSARPPRGCARPPARPGSPCGRPPAARSRPG